MSHSITIRSCSLSDAEALVSIGIKTFRETFDEMNTPENMMRYLNDTFTLRKIRAELQEPGATYFLAEEKDSPIGYARLRTGEKPADLEAESALEIQRLYVDKKHLGKRVGYLLMNTCLNLARERGHDVVWLGVWEHNRRARDFYKNWGFEEFGKHTFMLGADAQTDLLLKKKIQP